MEYYRLDFIYSYWIYTWFLLYIIGIITTPPKLLIVIGIIGNFMELLYLLINKSTYYNLTKFILINTVLKIIPFYLVQHLTITIYEIKLSLLMTFMYFLWLFINKINLQYFYSQFLNNYKTGKGKKTIVSEYYDILFSYIHG